MTHPTPSQNMLSTRNPDLLWPLFTNFDALFNILNTLAGALSLSASFGFDERVAPIFLVTCPLIIVIVLGDATMSDTEFKLRRYMLLFVVLFVLSGTTRAITGYDVIHSF